MDVSIQKYLAFIKTVECGSFTNAAEILSYSQSGISRMIGDLEKEWNVSLLERSRGGVRLTSDGLKLLPYAQSVCSEYFKWTSLRVNPHWYFFKCCNALAAAYHQKVSS